MYMHFSFFFSSNSLFSFLLCAFCRLPKQRFASASRSSEVTKWPVCRTLWCGCTTTTSPVSLKMRLILSLLFSHIHAVSCPSHHNIVRSSVCPAARKATRTYNSDSLHNMDSCFFCGSDCSRCRPGVALTVSSQLSAHSVSSTTCSWIYLILGVNAVLMVL